MPFFTREDLIYPYNWSECPSGQCFERDNGHNVLSFINSFGNSEGAEVKGVGHKIERLLHEHLPENINDARGIHNWMLHNWRQF